MTWLYDVVWKVKMEPYDYWGVRVRYLRDVPMAEVVGTIDSCRAHVGYVGYN